MKIKCLFFNLLFIISAQVQGYVTENSSFWPHVRPRVEQWTLQNIMSLRDEQHFNQELKKELKSLSVFITENSSIGYSASAAHFGGYCEAYIYSLTYLIPRILEDIEPSQKLDCLGDWHEAIHALNTLYPLHADDNVAGPALAWLKQKTILRKEEMRTVFRTNLFELNPQILLRFLALMSLKDLRDENFFDGLFFNLSSAFQTSLADLRYTPKEIFVIELILLLRKENVFLKTNIIGESITKTIIKSADDLSESDYYELATIIYPNYSNSLQLFNEWLYSQKNRRAKSEQKVPQKNPARRGAHPDIGFSPLSTFSDEEIIQRFIDNL